MLKNGLSPLFLLNFWYFLVQSPLYQNSHTGTFFVRMDALAIAPDSFRTIIDMSPIKAIDRTRRATTQKLAAAAAADSCRNSPAPILFLPDKPKEAQTNQIPKPKYPQPIYTASTSTQPQIYRAQAPRGWSQCASKLAAHTARSNLYFALFTLQMDVEDTGHTH